MQKFVLTLMASVMVLPAFADDGMPDQAFVEVAGEGILHVKADYIEAELMLTAIAKDGATAHREVDSKLIEVAKILQEQKVPEGALEAYQLTIMEERDYTMDEPKLVGFRATRKATLTIRDLERAQEIMDALVAAPIQVWEDIEAHVDNVEAIRKEAKIAAFKDARQRAETYARLANRELGEVYRIGDEVNWESNMLHGITVTGAAFRRERLPVFQVGDIEIKQRVRVIYLLD